MAVDHLRRAVAAILWLWISALFSWYASSSGSSTRPTARWGAVIGFMWISAIVILLGGAELDAEGASDRARHHDRLPEAMGACGHD